MSIVDVKLNVFEGPLELLYSLIKKNKIDIYDIPIAKVTEQYLLAIQNVSHNMESISEFLMLATELLSIKTKMLLPKIKSIDDEEIDPREELVKKLEELEFYKNAARHLKENMQIVFCKEPCDVESEIKIEDLLQGIDLNNLKEVFIKIGNKEIKEAKPLIIESLSKELYTVEKKLLEIVASLNSKGTLCFSKLIGYSMPKIEKVVTFMALLELAKQRRIILRQYKNFDEIIIGAC